MPFAPTARATSHKTQRRLAQNKKRSHAMAVTLPSLEFDKWFFVDLDDGY